MNKILIILIVFLLFSIYITKYVSSYYKNVSNILDKHPKIDIDYIFSKQDIEKEQIDSSKNIQIDNPTSNLFQNIFYDYYQTSVPLYDENMKCYFPIKKNITLDVNTYYNNITKIKNISKFYGKRFIKSLKGKCERFYIERWYYTLCPLMGAMQTLSYIKPNDNKKEEEKQEVNYLGYEINYVYNNSMFLNELEGEFKKYAEKNYYSEIMDIKEENLFNNYGKKNKIIGIYKYIVKFYGENVFDETISPNYTKTFVLEYSRYKKAEIKIFKTNIIKVINNNIILLNETLDKTELLTISNVKKIKILKNNDNTQFSENYLSFFNQSFFIYNEYVYSSKLNLAFCVNMNCHVTISNDINVYKFDIVVDMKLAILEKGVDTNKKLNKYKKENYCVFFGDEILYFFGEGEIEELIETSDPSTFILFGENLKIEDSQNILVLFNDTIIEYNNYVFINDIFNYKYIPLISLGKINSTHFKVKMKNPKDIIYFEKEITLDGRYIIMKNNTKNENISETKKVEAKYVILGNEKNVSLDSNTNEAKEKFKIENSKEEYQEYKVPNNKEFVFNFELSTYNYNIKDSYITLCFSNDKNCKPGEDYEMLIDLKNEGLLMKKYNITYNNNDSLVYSINKLQNNANKIISGIIYMNSTIYFNSVYKDENSVQESEIKMKYKIKNDSYSINYIIINLNKSKNIYIEDMEFIDYVSFDLFKLIFFYEQKFLLDDDAVFIDVFENGDYCNPIKAPRRVIVYYSCDKEGIYDFQLTNVYEDKKHLCVYHFYAKSKFLCNPDMLMKNYHKFSGLKTYCYLDN